MSDEIKALLDAVQQVHCVFGAPGDYGYDTPKGDALFALYRSAHAASSAIDNRESENANHRD